MSSCKVCGQAVLFAESDMEATSLCSCQNFVVIDDGGNEYIIRGANEQQAAYSYAEMNFEEAGSEEVTVGGMRFVVGASIEHFASKPL